MDPAAEEQIDYGDEEYGGNGGIQTQTFNTPQPRQEAGVSHNLGNSGVASDGRLQNASLGVKELEMGSSNHISGPLGPEKRIHDTASGNMEFQGSAPIAQNTTGSVPDISKANNHVSGGPSASQGIVYNQMSANANMNMDHMMVNDNIIRPQMDNGPTMLFVGELHWWTTDAELESVLSHYGKVKDVKFFDERASGKSKVAFASPQTLKQMGAAYASKNPQQPQSQPQGRRNVTEGAGRGPRGRGPMGPKNGLGNVGGMGGAAMGNFGQGLGNPGFGGPGGGMMHPQAMMGPGFDPSYMGRGAGYGGFSGPAFPGMMPPFPSVNPMGMSGVAPHVNPAFFGRGMTPNGMGMMGSTGMEGHPGGMWSDPGMGGWAGEEHGQKTRESSYGGDDGASDYRYGEENPEKSSRTNAAPREKERASERDWSGNSERRYRDEREQDYDRSDRERRHREDKDGYRDHRRKERDSGYEDDWDRGQSSSRSRSRSRAIPEDGHRSRSRDVDYGKRRRAPSDFLILAKLSRFLLVAAVLDFHYQNETAESFMTVWESSRVVMTYEWANLSSVSAVV
uniref:RRM domain-containing protein n=1 Tax=Chenopodium quinoa TaxID=63459 RepID=A0A803M6Y8_CHEQI